jgi:hypothetical protein
MVLSRGSVWQSDDRRNINVEEKTRRIDPLGSITQLPSRSLIANTLVPFPPCARSGADTQATQGSPAAPEMEGAVTFRSGYCVVTYWGACHRKMTRNGRAQSEHSNSSRTWPGLALGDERYLQFQQTTKKNAAKPTKRDRAFAMAIPEPSLLLFPR